jgi:hypothetical protein
MAATWSNSSRCRGVLLLAGLATVVAMLAAILAGPAPDAKANGGEYFCYYLAEPYGHSGDRCYASTGRYLTWVRALGYNHSACSDAYKEGLVASWACAPTETWSNSYFDGSRDMLGVIRNNVTCCTNQIWGYEEYN